jgi:phenylalanyl-tRNA synthetase alpha chain
VEHQAVVGVMKSLEADKYVTCAPLVREFLVLSDEGLSYVEKGSPEAQLLRAMPAEPIDEAGLERLFSKEFLGFAKGKAMKNKWITRGKGADGKYTRAVEAIERDELQENLIAARDGALKDAKVVKDLLSRSLVTQAKKTSFRISPGTGYAPVRTRLPADITKEMLDRRVPELR